MSGCPNSTESGCCCPEHALGLAEHAQDLVAYEAALAMCRPTKLRVVTMPPRREQPCAGTMTCSCERCLRDRASLRPQGDRRQPWQPKPSRRAA